VFPSPKKKLASPAGVAERSIDISYIYEGRCGRGGRGQRTTDNDENENALGPGFTWFWVVVVGCGLGIGGIGDQVPIIQNEPGARSSPSWIVAHSGPETTHSGSRYPGLRHREPAAGREAHM
jgi:hypothetical protein